MPRHEDTRSFRFVWFDRVVEVAAPDDDWLAPIRRHWGGWRDAPGAAPSLTYRIEQGENGSASLVGPDGTIELDRETPGLHAYHSVSRDLLGRVDDAFVLHATAVSRLGSALVLSGPSTFGKTTLGIHLALRGARWIADDLLLLSRTNGTVSRFARPLRLRPGGRALLSGGEFERARAAVVDREADDWIVDPSGWLGAEDGTPSCGVVVVLRPLADGEGIRTFPYYRIRVRAEVDDDALLSRLPPSCSPVRDVETFEDGSVLVEVENAVDFRAWVDARADDILYLVKYPASGPDFEAEPTLRPISRFQAALELAQEMQNRHPGSALAREYAGREVECVLDLAAALGDARTYALTPGDLARTLELLESVIGDGRPPEPREAPCRDRGGKREARLASGGEPS